MSDDAKFFLVIACITGVICAGIAVVHLFDAYMVAHGCHWVDAVPGHWAK